MKLIESIQHASRFSLSPTFSLFGVTANGHYTLLLTTKCEYSFSTYRIQQSILRQAEIVAERFKAEAFNHDGLEVRVDGQRIEFDGV
jgi:hypothetical protein